MPGSVISTLYIVSFSPNHNLVLYELISHPTYEQTEVLLTEGLSDLPEVTPIQIQTQVHLTPKFTLNH